MDDLAFRTANILAMNAKGTESLEIVVAPNLPFECEFHVPTVVAVTGQQNASVFVNGRLCRPWCRLQVLSGQRLTLQLDEEDPHEVQVTEAAGFRLYLAIRGGFPSVASYLGSKSTSMGLGGHQVRHTQAMLSVDDLSTVQGRALVPGDQLSIQQSSEDDDASDITLPAEILPKYPLHWIINVLSGPQDDDEFLTPEGRDSFYGRKWRASPSSNRAGIRLESPKSIAWARSHGGEGGSHPSNILDNGYAFGAVNINGDTPVILTCEGPDLGGYLCPCTVASGDR